MLAVMLTRNAPDRVDGSVRPENNEAIVETSLFGIRIAKMKTVTGRITFQFLPLSAENTDRETSPLQLKTDTNVVRVGRFFKIAKAATDPAQKGTLMRASNGGI